MSFAEHQIDLPPYRPPSEAHSVLLRVTRGCAWNRCTFCGMYKDLRFELRDVDEIRGDLEILSRQHPDARRVFLGDSDSLVHPRLCEIVPWVRRSFPLLERMTSYSRLSTLRRKSPEALRVLREGGLTRVHAGLESGCARILEGTRKGTTSQQAMQAGIQAVAAGFELCLYVLSGLGGEDDWQEHARETAAVVAAIRPRFLRLRSLALLPGTPLRAEWEADRFHPITPLTRLRETRLLLTELLAGMSPSGGEHDGVRRDATPAAAPLEVRSDHFTNFVWSGDALVYRGVNGALPADGERMLATLDGAIAAARAGRLARDAGTLALHGTMPQL